MRQHQGAELEGGPTPSDASDPAWMDVAELARRCQAESERFSQGRPHDGRYAHELFRRALVERDQAAWEALYHQYAGLVDHWVRAGAAFAAVDESSEYFVGAAFARFWRAITPERFASFPNVAALLHYLQRCAGCVVIDGARAHAWTRALPETAQLPRDQSAPEDEALARVARQEFWRMIETQLRGEAERVVVLHSFMLGMKPGDIFNDRPDLFTTIGEVYTIKRNVLARLGHSLELRRLVGEAA
jgi:DNA-directed RNA polymerase specialized sigma24 family protein